MIIKIFHIQLITRAYYTYYKNKQKYNIILVKLQSSFIFYHQISTILNIVYNILMSQQSLQQRWQKSIQDEELKKEIQRGYNGSYLFDKQKFLGRGGFGVVYAGLAKLDQREQIIEVAIKQYKKSQNWNQQYDKDKQLIILSKYHKELESKFVLQIYDIFQDKDTKRYFLVSQLAQGGNLSDIIPSISNENIVYKIALRLAQILNYLHFKSLKRYRVSQKTPQNLRHQTQQIGIMHRDIKPQNLVFLDKQNPQSLYLLDFGVAKVAYTQVMVGYNNCGTLNYKAPQIGRGGRYNFNVDVYSYGCTVYQILTKGQKLINYSQSRSKDLDQNNLVSQKLRILQIRLKNQRLDYAFWLKLLRNCLAYSNKERWSSEKLFQFLSANKPTTHILSQQNLANQPNDKQTELIYKKQVFQVSLQLFKLSIVQYQIDTLFQHLYFQKPKINKFILHVFLRFVAIIFDKDVSRLKQWFRQGNQKERQDKYNHFKRTLDYNRIADMKKSCLQKLEKELNNQIQNRRAQRKQGRGWIENIVFYYPEIVSKENPEPKKTLFEFCYHQRANILQNAKFAKIVATTLQYVNELDYYEESMVKLQELNGNLDLFSMKRLARFKKRVDQSVKDHKSILQSCRVSNSFQQNINRQENKTDLTLQIKEN